MGDPSHDSQPGTDRLARRLMDALEPHGSHPRRLSVLANLHAKKDADADAGKVGQQTECVAHNDAEHNQGDVERQHDRDIDEVRECSRTPIGQDALR